MYKLDLQELKIKYLIDKHCNSILKDSNIVAVGRGNKIIKGNMINIPTLTFIVKRKVSKGALSSNNIIPNYVGGCLTDIIEGGIPTLCSNKSRPAKGGNSIGSWGDSTRLSNYDLCGSIAYAVTDKITRKNLMFLTCCHVLDLLLQPPIYKTKVIQPCKQYLEKDGIDVKDVKKMNDFIIGSVINYSKISKVKEADNEIDAATIIVEDLNGKKREELVGRGLKNGTLIDGIMKAKIGDGAFWFGQSRESIQGLGSRILTVNTAVQLDVFEENNSKELIGFKNQITCSQAANKGDSGSLGIIQTTTKAFGMLMASGKNNNSTSKQEPEYISYFNDIETILNKMQVELLI